MLNRRRLLGLILFSALQGSATALTVLYDSGDTQPIAPYLDVLRAPGETDEGIETSSPSLGAADVAQLLPIQSPGLTPGPVQRKTIDRPFAAPLFLIGCDLRSAQWLEANRSRLLAMGAVGLVVDVPDLKALTRLATLAGGLTLLPGSGSDLAQTLGLRHYPVLITSDSIAQ